MEGLNKFKVLTIIFIAMFIFVIAAIYSNTKDASMKKAKQNAQQTEKQVQQDENNIAVGNAQLEEMYVKLNELNKTVEELSNKSGNSAGDMNCSIRGIMGEDGMIALSADAALQEARDNGKELILSCKF